MTSSSKNSDLDVGSYWEASAGQIHEDRQLFGEARFDVAVIGAGFTGLSAALTLAEANVQVCVLEANRVGWGASGRNGGFCCLGGGSKLPETTLVRRFGVEETKRFMAFQREAIETVAERISGWNLDVDRHSEGEVYLAHRERDAAGFPEEAAFLNDVFGLGARVLSKDSLREQGLNGPEFYGGLHVPQGFALNPLKYVLGLAEAVRRKGGRIFGRTPAEAVLLEDGEWYLRTPHGGVRAKRIVLAGNAYSREDVPRWLGGRLMPVKSSLFVTRPLQPEELAAQGWHSDTMASDTRHLLHYFRLLPDRRFLFGTRGGVFDTPKAQAAMYRAARTDFDRMFPHWSGVQTEYRWYGHVCLTRDLTAYVGPVPNMPGVYACLAYHGSGVALASHCGSKIADMLLGKLQPGDLPAVICQPLRRFPIPALRQLYLQCAYWFYGIVDR